MTGGRDSSGPVNVEPCITLVRGERLARVDSDPNPNRPLRGQSNLRLDCPRECVGRLRESNEEGIALGVDFDTAVALEDRPQQASVPCQRVRILLAELLQQARRAGDVGEEQGDGPRRQLAHGCSLLPRLQRRVDLWTVGPGVGRPLRARKIELAPAAATANQ